MTGLVIAQPKWPVLVGCYGFVMLLLTVSDRLDHRQFALSSFCRDPSEAGSFGYKHCFEHKVEWEHLGSWAKRYWDFVVPSLGPELNLVVAHLGLNLIGWLNYIIYVSIIGLLLWGAAKLYALSLKQPKRL